MADKQVKIKITSAVAIGGEIKRPGAVVTVAEELAKNLLHRGRAEVATGDADDADDASVEVDGDAKVKADVDPKAKAPASK